jgi:integrase
MTKRHPKNERIKRRYVLYLKDAKGRDEASIDVATAAIERFEEYNRRRDFRAFHIEQARGFKAHLAAARNAKTGKPLSASTICSTLGVLKAFFVWLADQSGYASKIKYADADYFNPPDNLSRAATARRYVEFPTLPQVRAMLGAMPTETEVQKRDRALVAFAILTGARDRAIVSFSLKHIDLERDVVIQDAREVRTKRAKTFTTWFFPVGDDLRRIVVDWITYLRDVKGFGPDDPLFPKSKVEFNDSEECRVVSIDRAPWANANRVRRIFRDACARAGLRYYNPHSIRNTLVQLAYDLGLHAEAFKAWSQNLGHDSCLTTFSSYGTIPQARQAEIIRGLARHPPESSIDPPPPEVLRWMARFTKGDSVTA